MPLKEQEKYGLVLVDLANSRSIKQSRQALYRGLKRVKNFPKDYRNSVHVAIPENLTQIRKEMRVILDKILDNKSLRGNRSLKRYIEIYNKQFFPFYVISDGSNLEKKTIFEMPPEEIDAETLIAFNLVRFLKNEKNRLYLHRCNQCFKFFISKKTGEEISKCNNCPTKSSWTRKQHADAQRDRRAKKREPKIAKKIREKYSHLKNQGHKDKEALGWLKKYFPKDIDLIFKELPDLKQYRSTPNTSSTGKI